CASGLPTAGGVSRDIRPPPAAGRRSGAFSAVGPRLAASRALLPRRSSKFRAGRPKTPPPGRGKARRPSRPPSSASPPPPARATTASAQTLCVYDATGRVLAATAPAGGTCGSLPCWKVSATSLGFKDKTAAHGVSKLALKGGAAGKGSVGFKGTGPALSAPTLP